MADQALSSGTNFALGLLVARAVVVGDFGAFSLAFAIYAAALGASRAANLQPLMVRFSGTPRSDWEEATKAASGAALAMGVVVGGVSTIAGLLIGGVLGDALIAFGIAMPGLLLQDAWRLAFFAHRLGREAFVNDLVWAGAMVPSIGLLYLLDTVSVGSLSAAWGISALAAAGVGIRQSGVLPRPSQTLVWWKTHKDLAPRFFGEFVTRTGTVQFNVFAIAAVSDFATVGAIRAAQILYGPYQVFATGMSLIAIPEGVVSLRRSLSELRTMARRTSAVLGGWAVVWTVALLLVPSGIGEAVMGSIWHEARSILIPSGVFRVALGVAFGAFAAMRALEAARRSFWLHIATAPLTVVGGVVGAIVGGASEAAWGLALGNVLIAVLWWWQTQIALDRHRGRETEAPDEVALGSNEVP